jgi:hypothetical protein
MTITTGSFAKDLWPGVESWYGMAYNEYPVEYTKLFETRRSTRAFEEIVGMQGFGLMPIKTEGSAITAEDSGQGFIDRWTHVTYGLMFTITREMYEDGLAATEAMKRAKALAFSLRQTEEIVGANVFNRAFSNSYTYGDGKELCATDLPYYSGGTWRNELSTAADLNETSLEQACIDIATQFKSDKGLTIAIRPKKVVVHPANMFEAERLFKSTLQYDTANNAVNAIRNSSAIPGGYEVNHYFSDEDAWFILTDCPDGLICFERRAPEFGMENDWDTENARFKATFRKSFGNGDKRSIFGSPGAA